jgi:hypothetical protein
MLARPSKNLLDWSTLGPGRRFVRNMWKYESQHMKRARGCSVVVWGIMLQAGRLRVLFQPHYGPGVDSVTNRNEYQESSWPQEAAGRCIKLTNSPPSVNRLSRKCESLDVSQSIGLHGMLLWQLSLYLYDTRNPGRTVCILPGVSLSSELHTPTMEYWSNLSCKFIVTHPTYLRMPSVTSRTPFPSLQYQFLLWWHLAGGGRRVMSVKKRKMSTLWVQLAMTRLRRAGDMKQQWRWKRRKIDRRKVENNLMNRDQQDASQKVQREVVAATNQRAD